MIKAIIFDSWGTIIANGLERSPIREIKRILRIKKPFSEFVMNFERVFMTRKYENLYDAFRAVCDAFNIKAKKFVIDKLVGLWNKNKLLAKPYEETINVLKKLKEKGYRLVLVSNTDCFSLPDVLDKFNLRQYFDLVLLSFETGMLKSEGKIYKEILKRLKIKRDEALVVGDSLETDIKGAEKVGIKAILIDRKDRRNYAAKIKNLNELLNIVK